MKAWRSFVPIGAVLVIAGWRLAAVWNHDPDTSHGWIVACFLGWWIMEAIRRRPAAAPPEVRSGLRAWRTAGGVLAVAVLAPVRLLLTPFPFSPGLLWLWSGGAVAVGLTGVYLAGGRAWLRHFAFGGLLVAVALPWPETLRQRVFEPTRAGIATAAAEVLNFSGHPAVARGTVMQVRGRWVGMEEACGGLRSAELALALAVMVGEAMRLGWRRRVVLVGVAAASAVAANFARVLVLSFRVAHGAPVVDPWHEPTGYLTYALVVSAVFLLGWNWRRAEPATTAGEAPDAPAETGARSWWWTAAVAFAVLEAGAWMWFGAGGIGWHPTWRARLPANSAYFTAVPLEPAAREMLRPDHYEGGSWVEADGITRIAFYVEWQRGQFAGQVPFVHNPTVCFPAAGCRLVSALEPATVAVGGQVLPFRGYRFTRGGQDVLAYFIIWDADRGEELVGTRGAGGWLEWWRERWRSVAERRSEIRAQLLTVAWVGAADATEALRRRRLADEIRRWIEKVPEQEEGRANAAVR